MGRHDAVNRSVRSVARVYRRAVREFLYLLITLPLAVVMFALVLTAVVAGALSVVVIGVPILAIVLAVAHQLPRLVRLSARRMLGWDWPDPVPRRRSLRGMLTDGSAWRALAYAAARFPLTVVGLYLPSAVVVGVVLILADGPSAWKWLAMTELVVAVVALPWFVRLVVGVDRILANSLLGQHPDAARIKMLETGRAALNADVVQSSRRLERDLHDGTQARLVAIGMQLDRLEAMTDQAGVRALAAQAKETITDALAELRVIIRGFHPPALERGLGVALATLAASSPVAALIDDRLDASVDDSVAETLYFTASELLANVARHAHATRAVIELVGAPGRITLTVSDDGSGGATADSPDHGLAGLHRRIQALDGAMTVKSPAGGPTCVTVTLPTP